MSARLGNAGASVLLVVAETAWVSLVFDALSGRSGGASPSHVDLPYLAFALPASVAVATVSSVCLLWEGAGPLARQRWLRDAGVVVVAVLGAAVTAGLIAGLSAPGSIWAVAFHPWALPANGALSIRTVGWAWAAAAVTWGRGAWLAVAPPNPRQAGGSIVIGAIVFLVVFGDQVSSHGGALSRTTGDADWLLFLFFPVGVTAAAWVHERDGQRGASRRAAPAASGAWLMALLVPFALVALVALAVGGAAGVVGPGVARAARAAGGALVAAVDWLFTHLPSVFVRPRFVFKSTSGIGVAHLPKGAKLVHPHAPAALGIVLVVLICLVVLAGLAFLAHAFVVWLLSRRRRPSGVEEDEVRESVFSWAHLVAQLRAGLRRLIGRLVAFLSRLGRRRRGAPAAPGWLGETAGAAGAQEDDSVRAAYRRFLAAVRAAARGRAPGETPRELAARIAADDRWGETVELPEEQLRALTALYEGVRYAGNEPGEPGLDAARAGADALATALREYAAVANAAAPVTESARSIPSTPAGATRRLPARPPARPR